MQVKGLDLSNLVSSDAQVAIETLNGAPMDGKILGVFPAQRRGDGKSSDDNDGKKAYLTSDERQRRNCKKKKETRTFRRTYGGFSTELLANTKRRLCVLLLWDIPTKASASKSGLKKWLSKRDIDIKRVKNIVLKLINKIQC